MAFSDSVKQAAWFRSGGRCECWRTSHWNHPGLGCGAQLVDFGFQYHHRNALSVGGPDTLSNCEVLCLTCHQQTDNWGST